MAMILFQLTFGVIIPLAVIAWLWHDSRYFGFFYKCRDLSRKIGLAFRHLWEFIDCIPMYPFGGHVMLGGKTYAVRDGKVSITGGWGTHDVLPIRAARLLASQGHRQLEYYLPRRDEEPVVDGSGSMTRLASLTESERREVRGYWNGLFGPGGAEAMARPYGPEPESRPLNAPAGEPGPTGPVGQTVQWGYQMSADGVVRRVMMDGEVVVTEPLPGQTLPHPSPLNAPVEEPLHECARCHKMAVLRVREYGEGVKWVMCDECHEKVLAGLRELAAKPAPTESAPAVASDVLEELEASLEVPEEDQPGWAESTG